VSAEPTITLVAEDLLTAEQAAPIYGVKPRTLLAWAREGRVPCVVLGPKTIRFTRRSLLEHAASKFEPGRPF
jgi:predicted site-specific integrase-resolvase